MELKTIVCPNCGANTTNVRNCEYCNSLLVRFADRGVDISNTSYLSGDCIFPELPEALKQNLRLQEEYPFEPTATDVYWITKETSPLCVSILRSGRCDWNDNTPIDLGSSNGGLIVSFEFRNDEESQRGLLAKFKELPFFPLFSSHNSFVDDVYVRQYAIDFGKDAEGAAMLISEILSQVFELNPTDDYDIITNVGIEQIQNARIEWYQAHGFLESDERENKKQILYYVIGGIIFVLYLLLTNL